MYKYPHIEDYGQPNSLYECTVPKSMTKALLNLFQQHSKTLGFPEKNLEIIDKTEIDNEKIIFDKILILNFIKTLVLNFQKDYNLGSEITMDESWFIFHEDSNKILYVLTKPHKWSFKIHLLCDSNKNYLFNDIFENPGEENKKFIYAGLNISSAQNILLKSLKSLNDG